MITGIVFDIRKFSIHDGPGIRTTVFFKGCPLRCRWCHNPEGLAPRPELMLHTNRCIHCGACLEVCPHGAISHTGELISTDAERCVGCGACVAVCYAEARRIVGREMTPAQVMAEIEQDAPFYDESGGGATFSGGEPLLQWEFLLELLRACKARGIHTAVDTCGFAPWEALDTIREYVDLFLYDLKLINAARHRQFTGVSNAPILRNLQMLAQRGSALILRLPLIPGVNDAAEDLHRWGEFVAALPHILQVDILPYHRLGAEKYERLNRPYGLPELRPPSAERLAEVAQILAAFGLNVNIGG